MFFGFQQIYFDSFRNISISYFIYWISFCEYYYFTLEKCFLNTKSISFLSQVLLQRVVSSFGSPYSCKLKYQECDFYAGYQFSVFTSVFWYTWISLCLFTNTRLYTIFSDWDNQISVCARVWKAKAFSGFLVPNSHYSFLDLVMVITYPFLCIVTVWAFPKYLLFVNLDGMYCHDFKRILCIKILCVSVLL